MYEISYTKAMKLRNFVKLGSQAGVACRKDIKVMRTLNAKVERNEEECFSWRNAGNGAGIRNDGCWVRKHSKKFSKGHGW
jgi:hypothetical protein